MLFSESYERQTTRERDFNVNAGGLCNDTEEGAALEASLKSGVIHALGNRRLPLPIRKSTYYIRFLVDKETFRTHFLFNVFNFL